MAVRVVRSMPKLSDQVEQAIDRIWQQEQERLCGVLFNGRVFSADEITPRLISGHWTEYRRIVAQMRDHDLVPSINIRPLAVGGIIESPDGVVFGRRLRRAIYQAGEWQLPPAGNVDSNAARPDGRVDVVAMLLQELGEELGIAADDVTDLRPVAVVEHPGSRVLDLGIALHTHLSEAAIRAAQAGRGNAEYEELAIVPRADLAMFLNQHDITGQAPMFLRCLGIISH